MHPSKSGHVGDFWELFKGLCGVPSTNAGSASGYSARRQDPLGTIPGPPRLSPQEVREKSELGRRWQARPEHWPRMGFSERRPPPAEWKRCFLRFGHLPEGGCSSDTRTGLAEEGCSVFEGFETPDGAYHIDVGENAELLWLARAFGGRKPAFVVDGALCRPGAAGEPTLKDLKIQKTLPEGARVGIWPELSAFEEETFAIHEAARALIPAVRRESPRRGSALHGEGHWKRVAVAGEKILSLGSHDSADRKVAFLFGLFHDSQRYTDGRDPDHGRRAAMLARELVPRKAPGLVSPGQFERLEYALALHADGKTTDDVVVGACWDADRLCLGRCGIRPDPRLLSTGAGRELVAWAGRLEGEKFEWWEVFRGYGISPEARYQKGPLHRSFEEFENVLGIYSRGVV